MHLNYSVVFTLTPIKLQNVIPEVECTTLKNSTGNIITCAVQWIVMSEDIGNLGSNPYCENSLGCEEDNTSKITPKTSLLP